MAGLVTFAVPGGIIFGLLAWWWRRRHPRPHGLMAFLLAIPVWMISWLGGVFLHIALFGGVPLTGLGWAAMAAIAFYAVLRDNNAL